VGKRVRSEFINKHKRTVMYRGYKVSASGVVYNKRGSIIKPKFSFRGKRIDYVFIDICEKGKKTRMSYHRFVYKAWNQDFDDPEMVITTKGRRFDYSIDNLVAIPRQEHLKNLAEANLLYAGDNYTELMETYNAVKDYMTIEEFAKRLSIHPRTLDNYIRKEKEK